MRNFYSCLIFVLSQSLVNAQVADFEYNIDEIMSEAKKLDHSKQYNEWKAKEDTIYKWYVAGSKRGYHVYPDAPNFESYEWYHDSSSGLNASLPYYYLRIRKNEDNRSLLKAYFEAITLSKDTINKLELIFYFSKEENRPKAFKEFGPGWWNNYISAAASLQWINNYIEQNLNDQTREYDLSWVLVKNHSRRLSEKNKARAYSYLKSLHHQIPKNGNTDYWELLFNLDPNQALIDLISFWDDKDNNTNFYITVVLDKNTPNKFNERTTQKGIAFIDSLLLNTSQFGGLGNDYFSSHLHTQSFLIDPQKGKELLKSQINELIKGNEFDFNQYYDRFNTSVIYNFLYNLDYEDNLWLMGLIRNGEKISKEITHPVFAHLYSKSLGMFQKLMVEMKLEQDETGKSNPLFDYGMSIINDDLQQKNAMLDKIKTGRF